MNEHEPCEPEHHDHEQITPPPGPQGFTAPGTIEDRRKELYAALELENWPNDDKILVAVENLARRIAVDMLESAEFKDAIRDVIHFQCSHLINDTLDSAAFKAKVIAFAQHWYYNERGQTRPDAVRQCDHQWLGFECDDEAQALGQRCSKCGQIRATPITDPADVPEEIVEIDEAGKVTAVDDPKEMQARLDAGMYPVKSDPAQIVQPRQSTDIPPLVDHSQIADRPCDVPDD